jgi:hypothetical protein
VGTGCSIGMLTKVASTSFMSCRLAPSTATPKGTPRPSVSKLRLTPCLARSVGFGPVSSPPKGALVIAPSSACQVHSMPFSSSYLYNPAHHRRSNTPSACLPENGHGPYWTRSDCVGSHSTDTLFAKHKRCPSSCAGRLLVAAPLSFSLSVLARP